MFMNIHPRQSYSILTIYDVIPKKANINFGHIYGDKSILDSPHFALVFGHILFNMNARHEFEDVPYGVLFLDVL